MDENNNHFYENLQKDLVVSAPILFELVEKHSCKHYNKSSYDWYHKAWQFLRILDKVSTPTWHTNFYLEILKEKIKDNSSILVSGTADYTILALIIEASKKLSVKPTITIIDICPAPLKICEWYSKKESFKVETIKFDILNDKQKCKGKFDIILTDAFLTRFDNENKKNILKFWKSVLAENGVITTTVRIDEAIPYVKISDLEKTTFVNEVLRKYNDLGLNYNIEIEKLASDYITNIKSFSYQSSDDLVSDLKEHNFEIIKFDDALVIGEAKKSYYKRIIIK